MIVDSSRQGSAAAGSTEREEIELAGVAERREFDALARLGELLRDMPKAPGGRPTAARH